MATRRPFACLLAVAALGLALALVLLLIAFPRPFADAVRHCTASGGLCASLLRVGHEFGDSFLLALLPWSLCHGLYGGGRQWWATRRAVHDLRALGVRVPSGRLQALCEDLGLGRRVTLVTTDAPMAFCQGLWWPRVWVSTGTLALLSSRELAAVLRHERAHLRGRHPLQLLIARALAAAFPFLPVLRELAGVLPRAQELVADRAVIRAGERQALGHALLALVDAQRQAPPLPLAPGMVGAIDARLDQLTGIEARPDGLSRGALVHTCLTFAAGLLLLRVNTLGPEPLRSLLALPPLPAPTLAFPWHCLLVPTLLCGLLHEVVARLRR